MNHDCGILYDTELGREIKRVRGPFYLSPEARHSLRVLLTTPGFSLRYLEKTLGWSAPTIKKEKRLFDPLDYRQEAIDNWNSITRDDALVLCHKVKGARPVICTVYMVEDIIAGRGWEATAKLWGVDDVTIYRAWKQTPFVFRRASLPDWFFKLVPT